MTTTLTREQLLRPSKRRYRTVQWVDGAEARIQSLTGGEMRTLRESFVDSKGNAIRDRVSRQRYVLLCWCLVDDAGKRLLTDEDSKSPTWDDIDGAVLDCVYNRCREWTGFLADPDWSAIEDAAKNSEGTRENS